MTLLGLKLLAWQTLIDAGFAAIAITVLVMYFFISVIRAAKK